MFVSCPGGVQHFFLSFFFSFFFLGGGGGIKVIFWRKKKEEVPSRQENTHPAAGPETNFFFKDGHIFKAKYNMRRMFHHMLTLHFA